MILNSNFINNILNLSDYCGLDRMDRPKVLIGSRRIRKCKLLFSGQWTLQVSCLRGGRRRK